MLRSLLVCKPVLRSFAWPARSLEAGRFVCTSPLTHHERLHEVLPPLESFAKRHIGPSEEDVTVMLEACGVKVGCGHGYVGGVVGRVKRASSLQGKEYLNPIHVSCFPHVSLIY
jgi:hypothetical protein